MSKTQTELSKVQGELNKISKENKDLKTLAVDITDLKCRSLRDNLVLIRISETVSAQPVMGLVGATGGLDTGGMLDSSQGKTKVKVKL